MPKQIKTHLKRLMAFKPLYLVPILALILTLVGPLNVSAAQITSRKVTLGSSAGDATSVSYTFNSAALPTSGTIVLSVGIAACTTASGSCTTPSGFSSSASTLASQPSGLGDASGWTVNTATSGELRIVKAGNATTPSGAVTIQWNGVHNPTASNTTFYLRATTYSGSAWTGVIDTGTVAVSTANQITVTASVDETLTFCVGTSGVTSSSCAGATGTAVSLGTLTTTSTGASTSQLGATTNATSGYSITVAGVTLTSGGNTITALASQTASTQGSEQFGINLKDNATPNIGSEPAGAGSGTPTANYGTADQFRYVSGDSIASNGTADDFRLYTVSYIANIANSTEPGTYQTTLTYVCTATF